MLVPKVLILFLIRNSGTVNYPYITFSELRIPLGPLTQKARHSLTALINREQVQGQVFLASICWFADVTDSVSTKGRHSRLYIVIVVYAASRSSRIPYITYREIKE